MPRRTALIIAASVTALIAAVIAIILLYVNVWSAPTKQDFEQAKSDVSRLETRYNDMATAVQLYSASIKDTKAGSENKDSKTRYDKTVSAVNESFRTIDQSRAVRNDDVRTAYDALVKKQSVIQSYADGLIQYRKSFALCIDVFDVTRGQTDAKKIAAAHKKAAADCIPVLKQLKRSKTPYFADYGTNYLGAIQKRQAVFDDYADKKLSESDASTKIAEIARTDLKRVLGSADGLVEANQNANAGRELKRLKSVLDQKIKQS